MRFMCMLLTNIDVIIKYFSYNTCPLINTESSSASEMGPSFLSRDPLSSSRWYVVKVKWPL